ncbi:hypothetical protein Pint_27478 [Pistacia integerrima]|uniref:Uncharacterized protein n=1 Tax=Pistacia integerrima TaxID=434235 RepID=A0ACC0YPS9_9ROSI|nr:hypothetical protein Pint_27478 [Pistacia integerrima]
MDQLVNALDTFNTAVVSPIYYAMFTSFTIFASAIMFKDYSGQSASSVASELCGFITVLSGTTVLHSTREPDPPFITGNIGIVVSDHCPIRLDFNSEMVSFSLKIDPEEAYDHVY